MYKLKVSSNSWNVMVNDKDQMEGYDNNGMSEEVNVGNTTIKPFNKGTICASLLQGDRTES